jgi:hypothetical protein
LTLQEGKLSYREKEEGNRLDDWHDFKELNYKYVERSASKP